MGVKEALEAKAEEVASKEYPAIDKDYSLAEALSVMERYKTDRAVLTEEGRARGIMTLRDVIFKLGTMRTKRAYIGGMHASSFMSEPLVSVGTDASLREALEHMVKGDFTSVPVLSEGKPVALLQRWDLARIVSDLPEAADARVRDHMRSFLVSVNLQTRIFHVRQLLNEYGISVVPVLDEGRFLGVIGVDEIANVFIAYYEAARGEPKRITPLKYVVVADAVKLRPPVVDPDASVAEAAAKMLEKRYRATIVVDGDKPVGFISGVELARFLLEGGLKS